MITYPSYRLYRYVIWFVVALVAVMLIGMAGGPAIAGVKVILFALGGAPGG